MESTNTILSLNGVVADIDPDAELRLGRQPYTYKDDIDLLWAAYRETHYFQRVGDDVWSVAIAPGVTPVGDEEIVRKVGEVGPVLAPLVREALFRYFHEHRRPILGRRPLSVVTARDADRLLTRSLPHGRKLPPWIELRVRYRFDVRRVYPEKQPATVLVVCDVDTCTQLETSCAELLERGIPLLDLYVQAESAGGDPRLSSRLRLVGRVTRVDGRTLYLDDNLEGYETVDAADVRLEPRLENVAHCVRHLLGNDAEQVLQRASALAADVNAGPERLQRIRSMFDHLRNVPLELVPGLPICVGPLLRRGRKGDWFPTTETLKRPALLFDAGGRKTDEWNERGLDRYGPYDRTYFDAKRPQIAVVCETGARAEVEQFMQRFLYGMPEVSVGTRRPYEKGFVGRYALQGADVHYFEARDGSAKAYQAACAAAMAHATDRDEEWHLAFAQISEASRQLSGGSDPYLVAKSTFMKRQVPVQEVTLEKMRSPRGDLVYILGDIGIAAYAKLGGVPWLLPADEAVTHEIVVGLGSYHVTGSRLGARERYVGITTVFTGDGRYVLESRTRAVPYDDYATALLGTLRLAVGTVRKEQNWANDDAVRLVFHAFKPVKDAEVQAVERLMAELGLTNVKFAFLHVVEAHPFLLFDEAQKGAKARGGLLKGVLAPERGTLVTLTRDECLLTLIGPRELKQASDGMPTPTLLRLHRGSTFRDMGYLARQVFAFACHSWRGFSLSSLPITIGYSQLIARTLRKLDDLPGWDAEAMLGRIGRTPWFL